MVLSNNITTESGITVGASTEDIRNQYGDLSEYPQIEHENITEGYSGNGMIRDGIKESFWFELKDGKVTRFGIRFPHC